MRATNEFDSEMGKTDVVLCILAPSQFYQGDCVNFLISSVFCPFMVNLILGNNYKNYYFGVRWRAPIDDVILDPKVEIEGTNQIIFIIVVLIIYCFLTFFEGKYHSHKCKPPKLTTMKGTLYFRIWSFLH